MIALKNLQFSYSKRGVPAISGLSADIKPGIHLLAGRNGAGKTTLLHIMARLCSPTSGECLVDGYPTTGETPQGMASTFLLDENTWFPGRSIRQFAELHSRFYPGFSNEDFLSNLVAFGLSGDEKMKSLSLGNRKKSQLAYILALGTDVLLLDEPTNALDIQSKDVLRRLLVSNYREGQTIIVSTHTVSELENLFDGIMILDRGEFIYHGTEEAVSGSLIFEVSRIAPFDALYSENQVGRVLSLLTAEEGMEGGRVDWRLLYSALHSPSRDKVLQCLNKTH